MKSDTRVYAMVAALMLLGGACSISSGEKTGSGGTTDSGGSASGGKNDSGGAVGKGGTVGTGGASVPEGTGGRPGTGGKTTGKDAGPVVDGPLPGAGGRGTGGGNLPIDGNPGRGGSAIDGRPGSGGTTGAGGSTGGGDPVKSAGCGKTPTLKSGNGQTISVSSKDRTYNLKVPDDYDNSKPYRLMLSYHPMGGTADQVSGTSMGKPFYGQWDLAGGSTIFVAPQGTSNQWANSNGVDVEFSRQLIAKLEDEFCIDKTRIFCEGFSMGGSMSYAMACAMGDTIRAVAAHSGGPMSGCVKHDKPVAYFMTHGTKDSVCTYPGYGVPEMQDFAKTNGCTDPDPKLAKDAFAEAMPDPTDTSGKTPICIDFKGCKEGYPVRACIFVGDHTPTPGGSTTSWVPAETWKFISQF
jgi:poly(3-hydroxybutyrate) depolymerase